MRCYDVLLLVAVTLNSPSARFLLKFHKLHFFYNSNTTSINLFLKIIFAAIDECSKRGDLCPPSLTCLKQKNGVYGCGCSNPNYKVVAAGIYRKCKGKLDVPPRLN